MATFPIGSSWDVVYWAIFPMIIQIIAKEAMEPREKGKWGDTSHPTC
jgi:hypothetical protein